MTLSRRNFLRTAALATLAFPAIVRARNLNSQIQIAAVGVDGKGESDINECATHPKAHFVGFCDIDAGRFAKIDKKHPGVTHYSDWREMFTWLGDGFDAVTVSTPDHMHALPTMVAMRMASTSTARSRSRTPSGRRVSFACRQRNPRCEPRWVTRFTPRKNTVLA